MSKCNNRLSSTCQCLRCCKRHSTHLNEGNNRLSCDGCGTRVANAPAQGEYKSCSHLPVVHSLLLLYPAMAPRRKPKRAWSISLRARNFHDSTCRKTSWSTFRRRQRALSAKTMSDRGADPRTVHALSAKTVSDFPRGMPASLGRL